MTEVVRLFIDAISAVALMVITGVIAGFATAAISGDTELSLKVAGAAVGVTGAVLLGRLWLLTRGAPLPPVDPVP